MNTAIEIEKSLESIKLRLEKAFPVDLANGSIENSIPGVDLSRNIRIAKDELNNFINDFKVYRDFISDNDLSKISTIANQFSNLLDSFQETSFKEIQTKLDLTTKILGHISKFEDIKKLNFSYNGYARLFSIRNLFNLINQTLDTFSDINIENILNNATTNELEEIIYILINIHNGGDTYQYLARDAVKAHQVFESISDRLRKLEATETLEFLEDKAIEVKENVGLTSNSSLIEVFKNEVKLDNKKIIAYSVSILALFIITLLSLLTLIYFTIFTDHFKGTLNFHFYGFYIAFFILLSGLITYLIKERKRLLNHQHYCRITYLELSALPLYTTQIDNKNKEDDLIVHLGDRYFKGPNPQTSNDEITSNMTTSKLSEVIKLAQEVKSTLK